MNRQGSFFAGFSAILLMVLVGFSFYCFSEANKKIGGGISAMDNLTCVHDSSDRLSFYLRESAKLSAQQAFHDIANASAIDKNTQTCFTKQHNGENVIQFSSSCMPGTEIIEKMFLSEYEKNMEDFIGKYPEKMPVEISSSFENNIVSSSAKADFVAAQNTSYAEYNLSYGLSEKINVTLTSEQIALEDFSEIYLKSAGAANECKNSNDVKSCIEGKIAIDGWSVAATPENGWVLFEFATKKYFFFEDEGEKFRNIAMKFGI